MTLEPFFTAPLAIQLHLVTVLPAAVLGAWLIIASRKGARPHRVLGMTYIALMVVTALSALFIHELNPDGPLGFSFIHLFVPGTIISLALALYALRQGDITGHKSAMVGVYIGGILVAGGLTFLPGRLMYQMVMGG